MNVKELRDALYDYPDNLEVILQKDAEGNGYSPLAGAADAMYQAESTWSGEAIHSDDYDPEDYPDAIKVVVLWPVS